MPRYYVFAIASASKNVGEFEADSKEAAIDKAYESDEYRHLNLTICHQCSRKFDLGDFELDAEEDEA